jgi:hypothetical protein
MSSAETPPSTSDDGGHDLCGLWHIRFDRQEHDVAGHDRLAQRRKVERRSQRGGGCSTNIVNGAVTRSTPSRHFRPQLVRNR